VTRQPSCGGCLCDRKADYQANEACGCNGSWIFYLYEGSRTSWDGLHYQQQRKIAQNHKVFVNRLANVSAVNFSTLPEENMKLKQYLTGQIYSDRNHVSGQDKGPKQSICDGGLRCTYVPFFVLFVSNKPKNTTRWCTNWRTEKPYNNERIEEGT
jgi:hypothetical protein